MDNSDGDIKRSTICKVLKSHEVYKICYNTVCMELLAIILLKESFREMVSYPAKSSWYNEQKLKATLLGHIPHVTWPLCNRIMVGCLLTDHVCSSWMLCFFYDTSVMH